MSKNTSLLRNAHFLGTKIRNLRKRNHLTMEDLSSRCIQIDAEHAPSVSYLSMMETGKRVPSQATLEVIAEVFQKKINWFLDEIPEEDAIAPVKKKPGGMGGMTLEPGFLFSKDHLQIAIPEMLSQTGVSGRQFAHLLIRAHQEHHQNHFPDLERAAEEIGQKRMPLSLDDVLDLCKQVGLKIKWFDRQPDRLSKDSGLKRETLVRSFFEPPGVVYVNEVLKTQPARLKYDLATHIAHCVLHNKDGMRSISSAGDSLRDGYRESLSMIEGSQSVDTKDILHAWRDFECSFFAGALLCPKGPFRQFLTKHAYAVEPAQLLDVSVSLLLRRMTAVSPYPHWHYFDAYPPGRLRAVYRGNGIPLPWGNMTEAPDPCQHWAVFRRLSQPLDTSSAQISILNVGNEPRIYCCESVNVFDPAGNNRVLCAGIDLNPAISAQGGDAIAIAEELKSLCVSSGGSTVIPQHIKKDLTTIAKILNINWIERGIQTQARLICSRGAVCPRQPSCYNKCGESDDSGDERQIIEL